MYISDRFAKYFSYLEVQKNSKVVNTQIRFQEEGSLFYISDKNALSEQIFGK